MVIKYPNSAKSYSEYLWDRRVQGHGVICQGQGQVVCRRDGSLWVTKPEWWLPRSNYHWVWNIKRFSHLETERSSGGLVCCHQRRSKCNKTVNMTTLQFQCQHFSFKICYLCLYIYIYIYIHVCVFVWYITMENMTTMPQQYTLKRWLNESLY